MYILIHSRNEIMEGSSKSILLPKAVYYTYEPAHNKMKCAQPAWASQAGHTPSLIKVFVARMKKLGSLADQTPGPMGAVLKNDVHYVLVVCNPRPTGAGDIAGVKCHVLSAI